jgi:hypothetical protein
MSGTRSAASRTPARRSPHSPLERAQHRPQQHSAAGSRATPFGCDNARRALTLLWPNTFRSAAVATQAECADNNQARTDLRPLPSSRKSTTGKSSEGPSGKLA